MHTLIRRTQGWSIVHNICNVGELAGNLFSGLMVDSQKLCAEVVIPVMKLSRGGYKKYSSSYWQLHHLHTWFIVFSDPLRPTCLNHFTTSLHRFITIIYYTSCSTTSSFCPSSCSSSAGSSCFFHVHSIFLQSLCLNHHFSTRKPVKNTSHD